jgi:predicted Rossmann-fold nucleotide-binding protein
MRRLHDTSISDSLEDLLDAPTRARCVAIMGGHDVARTDPLFRSVAVLARELVDAGFIVLTGGGPGLMEAANLGAYTSGFRVPDVALNAVLTEIAPSPRYDSPGWIESAHRAWRRLGPPADPLRAMSIGIPTWFYGHEPPNLFATHIAKYFENSVREEGLLALAGGGVIFAEGNGGTVQEMFQDACQNYYRVYDGRQSPMVVLGVDYWNPTGPPAGKRKPAWPLLHQLATEKGFLDKLLLTDDPATIVPFLRRWTPSS